MGLERLRAFLRRHREIALDTSVFIYQLESNARYVALTHFIFEWLERPNHTAVTSTITMTELLVRPYGQNDQLLADEYNGLLSRYPHLKWIAPSLEVADLAAQLRAKHNLRTPDAIQAATAMHAGATGLVTNDAVFKRLPGFEVIVLEELI